jgi:hypothetical protein
MKLIIFIRNFLKFNKVIIFLSVLIHFRQLIVTSNFQIPFIIKCSISQLGGWIWCIKIQIVRCICICYPRNPINWMRLSILLFHIISLIWSFLIILKLMRIIIVSCVFIYLMHLMGLISNAWRFFIINLIKSLSVNIRIYQIVWRCNTRFLFMEIRFTRLFSVSRNVLSIRRWDYIFCSIFIWWFCPLTNNLVIILLLFKYILCILKFRL